MNQQGRRAAMKKGKSLQRFNSISGDARVVVITTGGTIVQKFDKEKGGYVPKTTGRELIESISSKINIERIHLHEFAMIDSRAVDLKFLYDLSKLVQTYVDDEETDGIVIIHGTDTMEITTYFLHRTVNSPEKPIVLTGAMRVVSNSDYDGIANITNAIMQASNPQSWVYGFGVSINFAGKIHSPIYVEKTHSFAVDPFCSGMYGIIGIMHTKSIEWLNTPKRSSIITLPSTLDKLLSIPIVYAYPGATPNCLDGFVSSGFKALVVVAYGSGNINDNMYAAIESIIKAGMKVVLVTNCRYGGIYVDYGGIGGNQSLRNIGVIMASDLNAYQAMVVSSLIFDNETIDTSDYESYFKNKDVKD